MKDEKSAVKAQAAVRPLFITSQNSDAATGLPFRRWKDHFPHLVRRVGRKDVIPAADLEQAVQQGLARMIGDVPANEVDAAEQVRQLLRRAGGQ